MANPDQFVFVAIDDQNGGKRLTLSYSAKAAPAWGQFRGRGWVQPDPIVIDVPAPLRVEAYSVAAGAFTFPAPFAVPPQVDPVPIWSGDQLVLAVVSAITETGCTIALKRSRGTLLLTTGPFETVPAGVAVQGRIRVIGR